VVFVADDLAAWLVGLFAEAARKKLTTLVLGSEQDRALRAAATAAVQRTAQELRPGNDQRAEQVGLVISQVFEPEPGAPQAEHATMLEALQAGIAGQLAVLDDVGLTGTGRSSADVLGVTGTVVATKLTANLLQEILVRGSRGGPLFPLASQLNDDMTHLQSQRIEDMIGRLTSEVREARAQLKTLAVGAAAVPSAPSNVRQGRVPPPPNLSRIEQEVHRGQDVSIEVALTDDGELDYFYQAGHLLTLGNDNVYILQELLDGAEVVMECGDLALISIERLRNGYISVPEALKLLDVGFGVEDSALREDRLPLATPNHVLNVAPFGSFFEPEIPNKNRKLPWPPPCLPGVSRQEVLIGICDTGLFVDMDLTRYSWLADVEGDDDPLVMVGPQQRRIAPFAGHGTFVAGVAKCMAPRAKIYVANNLYVSGMTTEFSIVRTIEQLIQRKPSPDIVNLSAGMYTRNDWTSLGFEGLRRRQGQFTLICSAGNDSTDRPFWPAALDWTISVGALGADEHHRAFFSNYGDWVDVYALGEGFVNAYASGEYTYRGAEKRPQKRSFAGMARWDGTSFSAALVTGLIAARMSQTHETSAQATQAALTKARAQEVAGVGPLLRICDEL
jgi:subtilisin family serine protease